MRTLFLTLTLILTLSPAQAASVGDCEYLDSIGNLIGSTKSYAEGTIKTAYVSTEEPAAAPDHLLIFVYDNYMGFSCTSINAGPEKTGFSSIDFNNIKSSYDSNKGLLLKVPAYVWNGEDGSNPVNVNVRINRSNPDAPLITIE